MSWSSRRQRSRLLWQRNWFHPILHYFSIVLTKRAGRSGRRCHNARDSPLVSAFCRFNTGVCVCVNTTSGSTARSNLKLNIHSWLLTIIWTAPQHNLRCDLHLSRVKFAKNSVSAWSKKHPWIWEKRNESKRARRLCMYHEYRLTLSC